MLQLYKGVPAAMKSVLFTCGLAYWPALTSNTGLHLSKGDPGLIGLALVVVVSGYGDLNMMGPILLWL